MRATMRTGVRRRPGRWLLAMSATTVLLLALVCEALGPMPSTARLAALVAATATLGSAVGAASVLLSRRRYGTPVSR